MVTGDIGCTILGMNPPFNTVWNEVCMGASIPLAQGYVHAGVKTPVIATIGDSTFFHAGMRGPGQRRAAPDAHHPDHHGQRLDEHDRHAGQPRHRRGAAAGRAGSRTVDIARIVPALGVDFFASRPVRPGPDDRGDPERAQAAGREGDAGPAGVRDAGQAPREASRRGPGDRRELQPVQAVHHPDRLSRHQPGGRHGAHRPRGLLRLRPVRRGVQPGCDRVHPGRAAEAVA